MKHVKFLTAICFAAGMSFAVSSCNNSGEEKKADDNPADSTGAKTAEPATPAKPANMLIITAKVANYAKWLPEYESHDSVRQASGLHNYVIARGIKDTNMVMVALKMDDAEKAKAFVANPDLKARMQKSGIISAPTISFQDVQFQDNSENTTSTRVMINHKVKDYDAWKKVFDEDKPNRTAAGFTDRLLAYEIGDNHKVTIVLLVSDMKKAEEFSKSPELKAKMEAGGVEGPPSFFYYTIAKKY